MSTNRVSEASGEQIKQGVREVYAARVSDDAGQLPGSGVNPARIIAGRPG